MRVKGHGFGPEEESKECQERGAVRAVQEIGEWRHRRANPSRHSDFFEGISDLARVLMARARNLHDVLDLYVIKKKNSKKFKLLSNTFISTHSLTVFDWHVTIALTILSVNRETEYSVNIDDNIPDFHRVQILAHNTVQRSIIIYNSMTNSRIK